MHPCRDDVLIVRRRVSGCCRTRDGGAVAAPLATSQLEPSEILFRVERSAPSAIVSPNTALLRPKNTSPPSSKYAQAESEVDGDFEGDTTVRLMLCARQSGCTWRRYAPACNKPHAERGVPGNRRVGHPTVWERPNYIRVLALSLLSCRPQSLDNETRCSRATNLRIDSHQPECSARERRYCRRYVSHFALYYYKLGRNSTRSPLYLSLRRTSQSSSGSQQRRVPSLFKPLCGPKREAKRSCSADIRTRLQRIWPDHGSVTLVSIPNTAAATVPGDYLEQP